MATLQIYKDGAWETYAGQPLRNSVEYFRWQGETQTAGGTYTSSIPTQDAKYARAYLSDVAGTTPAITSGPISFVVVTDGVQATTNGLSYAGGSGDGVVDFLGGTMHSSTAGSNTCALVRHPAAETAVLIGAVTKGNADNTYDIIIEVHRD